MSLLLANQDVSAHVSQKEKTVWQCPSIERIDIKRTLGGAGSFADTSPNPTAFAP